MALLFFEGFDHYGNGSTIPTASKWGLVDTHSTLCNADSGSARTGLCGARISYAAEMITQPFTVSGGVILGFAMRNRDSWNLKEIFQIYESSTLHLSLVVDATGKLLVKRGDGTTLATGTTVLALNNWYYIELKATIHDTTGSFTLKIDGTNELTASSQDTRNGGTGVWDRIRLQGAGSFNYDIDDIYICDTSGSAPWNDFLGNCKVDMLMPQTGNGTNAGLTPSTGTDHGALVDENGPNTTDYNSSATVGTKDTYNYPSLALTGIILGIQTNLYAAKSDAGARTICAVVRAGGTDYDGAAVSPLTTYRYFTEVRQINPNTGVAWTSSDITALEAGMKIVS